MAGATGGGSSVAVAGHHLQVKRGETMRLPSVLVCVVCVGLLSPSLAGGGRLQGRVQGRVQGNYGTGWSVQLVAEAVMDGIARDCGLPTSVHPETLDCFPELWELLENDPLTQRAYRYLVEAMAEPGVFVAASHDGGATIAIYHGGMVGLGPGFLAPWSDPTQAEEEWVSSM